MVYNSAAQNYMDALANGRLLTREQAPGFVDCVEDLARKAGITEKLHIELIPHNIPNAHFRFTSAGKTLSFSEGLCHTLENTDLRKLPNGKMQAVISHELSHARHSLGEMLPRVALLAGIPLAAMGAMYLIDKTNQKLREHKEQGSPESFWKAFNETLDETRQMGVGASIREFTIRSSPLSAKIMQPPNIGKPKQSRNASMSAMLAPPPVRQPKTEEDFKHIYEDMSWGQAIMEEAKYLAVGAAALVPALAAVRHLSQVNEFRADRFSVALTGSKDMAHALKAITAEAESILGNGSAKTPLEKSWIKRVMQSTWGYIRESFHTHPSTTSRVEAIEAANILESAKHFGL